MAQPASSAQREYIQLVSRARHRGRTAAASCRVKTAARLRSAARAASRRLACGRTARIRLRRQPQRARAASQQRAHTSPLRLRRPRPSAGPVADQRPCFAALGRRSFERRPLAATCTTAMHPRTHAKPPKRRRRGASRSREHTRRCRGRRPARSRRHSSLPALFSQPSNRSRQCTCHGAARLRVKHTTSRVHLTACAYAAAQKPRAVHP